MFAIVRPSRVRLASFVHKKGRLALGQWRVGRVKSCPAGDAVLWRALPFLWEDKTRSGLSLGEWLPKPDTDPNSRMENFAGAIFSGC